MYEMSSERHGFTLELGSKEHVKRFILDGTGGKVLVEGFLGELVDVSLVEGVMLEISGSNGAIRVEVTREELGRLTGSTR